MKKLLALFLLLVMLIPMFVVAQAEEVADKPFYLLNMTAAESEDIVNVYPSPYFWAMPINEDDPVMKVTWGDKSPEVYNTKVDNIPTIAAALKEHFEDYPAGTRYFNFIALHGALHTLAEDVIFLEAGVELTKDWLDRFLKEYKSIGGELDGLIIDLEYENAYSYFLYERVYTKDMYVYNDIVKNPKYQTLIRPKLEERGFKFYEKPHDLAPEIFGIYPNLEDEKYANCRGIWDAVVRDLMNQYVNQACEPLFAYYPDAVLTDYQSKNTYAWLKDKEYDGGLGNGTGNINHTAGNVSSEDIYNVRPRVGYFKGTNNMAGYNNVVFENIPYNHFITDVNTLKLTAEAAINNRVSFWITDWRYNGENENSVSKTPYYTEAILHAAMLDPDPFGGYIIPVEIVGINDTENDEYLYAVEIASDIFKEINRLLGKADRKPIYTDVDWNSKFYVSGMYAGGKNYWRVTPDTTVVSLENFKVAENDPTFSAAGKTITFPGGKIVEDGYVREVGTCGYWIETAADVTPIVTVEDNYYYNYPAFIEGFEGYEAGTELDGATLKPNDIWTLKKSSKSSAYIKKDDEKGSSLALKGNSTLTNTKATAYVNAIDEYAKRQAWEVEVTVPADMAADAEIVLLNCIGQKAKSNDVGMKIAGGKLYYDKAGEYVELADITLGSQYKVKRELDMTVADALTSSYYLYDATGALLASVKDVPMTELKIPMTSISMGCKNIAGEPVILDNYRVYLAGANTNFELYDVANGIEVTDIAVARDKDTAYRFAWVNATAKEKSYAVVAAFYNGDTLVSEQVVKEIKAAPNTEGVETGIVKIETAGQKVLVYLKENITDEGGKDNGAGSSAEIDWLLIGGAVVVVIMAALVVVMFVINNNKKRKIIAMKAAKKAPKTETPTEE